MMKLKFSLNLEKEGMDLQVEEENQEFLTEDLTDEMEGKEDPSSLSQKKMKIPFWNINIKRLSKLKTEKTEGQKINTEQMLKT